jgi:hypothetical protein
MTGGTSGRAGEGLSNPRVRAALLLVVALLAVAFVLSRLPRSLAAAGTLVQCIGGWPAVTFEGQDWRNALPDRYRTSAGNQIPIAEWPSGLHFDEAAGALLSADGDVLFYTGDQVKIKGSVIEVSGDPSPCFIILGLKVEEIASPAAAR